MSATVAILGQLVPVLPDSNFAPCVRFVGRIDKKRLVLPREASKSRARQHFLARTSVRNLSGAISFGIEPVG
jgi:hypothetical protein